MVVINASNILFPQLSLEFSKFAYKFTMQEMKEFSQRFIRDSSMQVVPCWPNLPASLNSA